MILVTGAAGLSGRAVIDEFVRHGVPVRALVRDGGRLDGLADRRGVEVVVGDMLRPQTLEPALDGVERALLISSGDQHLLEVQCTFIDAAERAGVNHIVKFSGQESGIGFDPYKFRFTRNHEQIQKYLESSGMAWTHLRPSQFMQVYLRQAGAVAAQNVLALPLGDIRLAPVDNNDVAKVAFAVLTTDGHAGKRYSMTGPEALTMSEIASAIGEVRGAPVTYASISPEQSRAAMIGAGMPEYFADAVYDQTLERRRHSESRVSLETHRAFGVTPTTFADFVRRHADAFRPVATAATAG
jgi:uncharacterized protein YbjT (DUF2867 family)